MFNMPPEEVAKHSIQLARQFKTLINAAIDGRIENLNDEQRGGVLATVAMLLTVDTILNTAPAEERLPFLQKVVQDMASYTARGADLTTFKLPEDTDA